MLLNINHKNTTPLYIQIYQDIKNRIHNNELQTNEKLTSKRQLAKLNNVSENTVMNAYDQLLIEGYIYSKERKGYYVANVNLQYELPSLDKIETEPKRDPTPEIDYNLVRSKPDEELFPYSVFTKLHRNIFNHPQDRILTESNGQGLYELRVTLQHYLARSRGVPCTADQIILGPSTEYLISVFLQLLDEQPVVGLEDPGYHGFNQLFDRLNITKAPILVDDQGMQVKALKEAQASIALVTSNHQFPTGNIMPLARRQALLNWAYEEEDRYIIENDYDSEFKYSGIPIPALKFLDQNNKVIHLGNFTRVLSPGIRLSYMVLPENFLPHYQKMFSQQSAALSTSEQWIIRDFILDGHLTTHLNRSRTFYKQKREHLIEEIYRLDAEAEILGENAGLHLLIKPSITFDDKQFKKLALENRYYLSLLSDYSYDKNKTYKNIIFISFSNLPKNDIKKVTQDLYHFIKQSAS